MMIAAVITFTACSPSKEKKAEELVKSTLAESLYHPESYKSTFIKVDSAYYSAETNEECLEKTEDLIKLIKKFNDIDHEISSAKRNMIFYGGPYQTNMDRHEYQKAKEKLDTQKKILTKAHDKFISLFNAIKEIADKQPKDKVCGWYIHNKFTSLNGNGNRELPGEYIFIANLELTECFGYEEDVYETLTKLLSIIIESEDTTDFVEKCQELSLTE